jgi:hypothetical protein
MAGIYDIILRVVEHTPLFTKNASLSWEEEDNNFVVIFEAIKNLQTSGEDAFEAYDPGEEYSEGDFVSYSGNIWEFINPVAQTGIAPGSDPSTWEVVSLGLFAHEKNKDQYLGFGGSYQVSAQDLHALLNGGFDTDYWNLAGNELTERKQFGSVTGDFGWDWIINSVVAGSITDDGRWTFGTGTAEASTHYTYKSSGNTSSTYLAKYLNSSGTEIGWIRDDGSLMFKSGKLFIDNVQYSNFTPANKNVGLGPEALEAWVGSIGLNVGVGDRTGFGSSFNYSMMMGPLCGYLGQGEFNFLAGFETGRNLNASDVVGIGNTTVYGNVMNSVTALNKEAARGNNTFANVFTVARVENVFFNNIGDKGYTTLQTVTMQSAMSVDGVNSSAAASVFKTAAARATDDADAGNLVWQFANKMGTSDGTRQTLSDGLVFEANTGYIWAQTSTGEKKLIVGKQVSFSSNYTANEKEISFVYDGSGGHTLTLYDAADWKDTELTIINNGSGNLTVNGGTSVPGTSLKLISNGTNWL